jgi:hypothetical protein
MTFSQKVYDLLLRAYPSHYQVRYAEPMRQLFRDQLREKRRFLAFAAFWIRTLADWVVSVRAQYRERVARPGHHMYLAPARRCIFFAREEASSFSKCEISLEDLVVGIARQDPSLFEDAEALIRVIEVKEAAARRTPPMEDLRLSHETKLVLAGAQEIAQTAGRHAVGPRDLIGGILRQPETFAARLLREHIRSEPREG